MVPFKTAEEVLYFEYLRVNLFDMYCWLGWMLKAAWTSLPMTSSVAQKEIRILMGSLRHNGECIQKSIFCQPIYVGSSYMAYTLSHNDLIQFFCRLCQFSLEILDLVHMVKWQVLSARYLARLKVIVTVDYTDNTLWPIYIYIYIYM